jgi:hypothetical protein
MEDADHGGDIREYIDTDLSENPTATTTSPGLTKPPETHSIKQLALRMSAKLK